MNCKYLTQDKWWRCFDCWLVNYTSDKCYTCGNSNHNYLSVKECNKKGLKL